MTESIVGETVGHIVIGAHEATAGHFRDGFIGCVKVSVVLYLSFNSECDAVICSCFRPIFVGSLLYFTDGL